jgi:hypothetical protein
MKLSHTSDETQRWVKSRRIVWWQTTGLGILVGIATIIGFRDQIAAQLDWVVITIHGPSKLIQDEQIIAGITNDLRSIKFHIANIDRRLNIEPEGEGTKPVSAVVQTFSTNKLTNATFP